MAEGKDRYQDYKTDAADGKVNWMQQGKDAMTDYKADNLVHLLIVLSHSCLLTHCRTVLIFDVVGGAGWSSCSQPPGQPHVINL